jgi:hypothetical protein
MQILNQKFFIQLILFLIGCNVVISRIYIPPISEENKNDFFEKSLEKSSNHLLSDIEFEKNDSDKEIEDEVDHIFDEAPKERMLKDLKPKKHKERKLNQTIVQQPLVQSMPQYVPQQQMVYQPQYVPVSNLNMSAAPQMQPIYVQQPMSNLVQTPIATQPTTNLSEKSTIDSSNDNLKNSSVAKPDDKNNTNLDDKNTDKSLDQKKSISDSTTSNKELSNETQNQNKINKTVKKNKNKRKLWGWRRRRRRRRRRYNV